MSKPKEEINTSTYIKDIHLLYEIIGLFSNTDDLKLLLKDMLTSSELRMFKRRWYIANLLYDELDIRTIAHISNSSTSTVIKIKQILFEGKGGLKKAIEKARLESRNEKKSQTKGYSSTYMKKWFK